MAVKLDFSVVDTIVEKSGYKQEAIISILQRSIPHPFREAEDERSQNLQHRYLL